MRLYCMKRTKRLFEQLTAKSRRTGRPSRYGAAFLSATAALWVSTPANAASPSPANGAPPTVSATLTGRAEVVFDTKASACEKIDIPDGPARAFRDYSGQVHLISPMYVARAMVGPSLSTVKHDCRVIFRSADDPDPSHFNDRSWPMSFYTLDGRRLAALVHTEYHGWSHSVMCDDPKIGWPDRGNCWWNTITFAESKDGGYSFAAAPTPANLVASVPYRYERSNRLGAYGYWGPSNIVHSGTYYYAMINDWPHMAQKYGACLIRTTDVFDAKSWRAWDGRAFTIRFVNPYGDAREPATDHVCSPVLRGDAESLVVDEKTGYFVVDQFTKDGRFGHPGLYLTASRDLIHWSKPSLVASTYDLQQEDHGSGIYIYFSLIDPSSTDRNFSTIGDSTYVYYVRIESKHSPYVRTLIRRKINIRIGE